jgi:tRNA threonylcarbamoyladenosine biosynthesis protein TsaB
VAAILGLDTASDDTAVAVLRDGAVVAEEVRAPEAGRPLHGPALLTMVEAAVAAGGGWQEIELIAVGTGPGSYTGLRVGLATAKALARSAGCAVSGVCTLDALAAGAGDVAGEAVAAGPLICALDARRGQVFAARYERADDEFPGGVRRVGEPFVCDPAELRERLGEIDHSAMAVGSGALRFREILETAGLGVPEATSSIHRVSARWIARLGSAEEGPVDPIYLRAPDAERWRERDKHKRDRP